MVSSTHNVCAKDVYVAIVSTIVETDRPEQEIAPGLALLGPIYDKYVYSSVVSPKYSMLITPLRCPDSSPSLHCTLPQQTARTTTSSSLAPTMLHLTSRLSLRKFTMFGRGPSVPTWC